MEAKGYSLVLLTAIVSGFSIFLNSFAVGGIDAVVFTTLKNSLVAVALLSLILLLKDRNIHKILDKRILGKLMLIGLIGGAIPFALFFTALQHSDSVLAGFLHKTLFIWVAIFAVVLLREKLSRKFLAGAALLFAGNLLFIAPGISFSLPLLMILAATIFWALENVISKHALKELSGSMVAFGRMFFGSVFLLAFLAFTGGMPSIAALSFPQLQWILLTSAFLFLYVFTYYNGLKRLPVHKAAAILLLAQPITAILSLAFLGNGIGLAEGLGLLLIVLGAFTVIGFSYFSRLLRLRGVSVARQ